MEVEFTIRRKSKKYISIIWADLDILGIASTFDYKGGFDRAFGDVGPPSN